MRKQPTLAPFALIVISTLLGACANDSTSCADGTTNCFTHESGSTSTGGSSTGTLGDGTSTTTGGAVVIGGATTGGITTTGGTSGTTGETINGSTTTTGSSSSSSGGGGGGTTTATTGSSGTSSTTTGSGLTVTQTLTVDTFTNATTFSEHENSLNPPQLQSDNGTMSIYEMIGNQMELQCDTSGCYWYSLLAAQGTCLDISGYTHVMLTVQGPPGSDGTFQLQNNSSDCNSTTFTGSANVDLATYLTFDSNAHTVYIPISAFSGVDLVHSRAVAVLNLSANSPVYFSDIALVVAH